MKKSDILTPLGLIMAFGFVILGICIGKSGLKPFIDGASVAITCGGSFAAVLITFSMDDLKTGFKATKETLRSGNVNKVDLVDQFKELARKVRKDGPLAVEQEVSQIEDDFLRKGLELAIDGIDMEDIKEILEIEIGEVENNYSKGAKIYKVWGGYAPAFGMVGTLIGLIQMLANLQDSSTIASGMAKALVTTYYGSLIANIFASPISQNLLIKSGKEVTLREMMVEGILAIQSGVNPRIVEDKLVSYLSPQERSEYMAANANSSEGVA